MNMASTPLGKVGAVLGAARVVLDLVAFKGEDLLCFRHLESDGVKSCSILGSRRSKRQTSVSLTVPILLVAYEIAAIERR